MRRFILHTKSIRPKVNVITSLEFELTYLEDAAFTLQFACVQTRDSCNLNEKRIKRNSLTRVQTNYSYKNELLILATLEIL